MRRFSRICLLLAVLVALSGCGLSAEELYRLPEATEDYYDLQEALNEVLDQGYNYLAPTSGARQEPVQLTDLDGDGVDEAVAFFRSSADGAVQIYIFSKQNDVYVPAAVIDGAGSGVAAVEYADLDGLGHLELIVTYQVSEVVTQALQVYRYDAEGVVSLLTDSCSRYEITDLDGDGLMELFCLTGNGAEEPATVKYYDGDGGELHRGEELRLSFSYDNLRRIQQGVLSDDTPGLWLSGVAGDGTLKTDIFVAAEDSIRQVSPDQDILSFQPVDGAWVYPTDIDGDGIMEAAQTEILPGAVTDSRTYFAIRWYELSGDGTCEDKLVTYQNFGENWYFQLPEYWDGIVTAKEVPVSSTVSAVSFYRILVEESDGGLIFDLADAQTAERILTIYSLRGANRQKYAEENELTILYSDSEVIYAVDLSQDAWEGTITLAQVSEMFHILSPGAAAGNMIEKN